MGGGDDDGEGGEGDNVAGSLDIIIGGAGNDTIVGMKCFRTRSSAPMAMTRSPAAVATTTCRVTTATTR